jgi:hypothetical protein
MPEKKQGLLDYLTKAGARGVESTLEIPDVLVQGVFGVGKGLKGLQEGAASLLGQPKPFQTISIPAEPIGLARRFRERAGLKPVEQLPAKERETEEAKKTLFDPLNYAFFLSEAALKKTALAAAIGGSMFPYERFYGLGFRFGHEYRSIGLGEKFRQAFRQWFNKLKPDEVAALMSQDVDLDKAVKFLIGQQDLSGVKAPQELTKAALDWGIAGLSEERAKAVEKFIRAKGGDVRPLSGEVESGGWLARTERQRRIGKQELEARPIADWVDTIVDTMDLPVVATAFNPDYNYGTYYLVAPEWERHVRSGRIYPDTGRAVAVQILTKSKEARRYELLHGLPFQMYEKLPRGHYEKSALSAAGPVDAIHASYAINNISVSPFKKALQEWEHNRDNLPLALVFDEIQSDLAQKLFSKHSGQRGRRISAEATDILPFGKYIEELLRKPPSQKTLFQEFTSAQFSELAYQLNDALDALVKVMRRMGPREPEEYDEESLRKMARTALGQIMLAAKLSPLELPSRARSWNDLLHHEYLTAAVSGTESTSYYFPHPTRASGAIDYWASIERIRSKPEQQDWSVFDEIEQKFLEEKFEKAYNLFIPVEEFLSELATGEILGLPEKLARKSGFSEKEKFNLLVQLQPQLSMLAEMSKMGTAGVYPMHLHIIERSSRLAPHFAGPVIEGSGPSETRLLQDWGKALDAVNEYATSLWKVYDRLLQEFFRPIKPIITEWPKAIVDSIFALDEEVRDLIDRGDIRYIAIPTPEAIAVKYHSAQVRLAPLEMSAFWHNLYTTPEAVISRLRKLPYRRHEHLTTKEATADFLIELSKEQFTPELIDNLRSIGWDRLQTIEQGLPLGLQFRSRYRRLLRALDSSEIRGMAGGKREPEIVSAAISSYLKYLAKLVRAGEVPFTVQTIQSVPHLVIPTYGQYVPTLLTYGIEPLGEWEHNSVLRAVEGINFEKAVNALTIGRLYHNTIIPLLSAYLKQFGFVRRAEPAYLFVDREVLRRVNVLNPPDYLPLIVWERP